MITPTSPTDAEVTAAATAHCFTIPEDIGSILAARVILASHADRFEIAHSLKDARAILEEGKLPRWEWLPTSEQWQTRNGSEARYLYLYWQKDRYSGTYKGPGGRRKTYIGAKEPNQLLAHYLSHNLIAYNKLQDAIRDNAFQLRRLSSELENAAVRARGLASKMDIDVGTLTTPIHCPSGAQHE